MEHSQFQEQDSTRWRYEDCFCLGLLARVRHGDHDHVHCGFRIAPYSVLTLPDAKESKDGEDNRLQDSKG